PEWEVQVVTQPGQVRHAPAADGELERTLQPLGDVVARWLLLALFGLLLAEVVLAWRFGHYSAAVTSLEESSQGRARTTMQGVLLVLPGVLLLGVLGIAGILAHDAWTGDFLGFLHDSPRRLFESALGIPPPAPGEGSHWRLELRPYFWDNRADPWLAFAVAA